MDNWKSAASSSFSGTTSGAVASTFSTTNGDGKPAVGDTIVITFDKAISPTTVCSSFSTTGANSLGANGSAGLAVVLTKQASGHDTLSLTDSSSDCGGSAPHVFNNGVLDLGTTGYVTGAAGATAVFQGSGSCTGSNACSNLSLNSLRTTLTITLGPLASGTVGTVTSNPGVTYTPDTNLQASAGGTVTGSATDSAAKFF